MANIDQQAYYWQSENCFAKKMDELTKKTYLLEKLIISFYSWNCVCLEMVRLPHHFNLVFFSFILFRIYIYIHDAML
jgi:hypothetical protein